MKCFTLALATLVAVPQLMAAGAASNVTGVLEIDLIPNKRAQISPIITPPRTTASSLPTWTVLGLAGDPNTLFPYGSTVPAEADQLIYGTTTTLAAFDDGTTRFWSPVDVPGSSENGFLLTDPIEPLVYARSALSSPLRLVVQGQARTAAVSYMIAPGEQKLLLRPDGRDFSLITSSSTAFSSMYRMGMTPGTSLDDADVVTVWNAELQAWESIFYHGSTRTFRSDKRTLTSTLWAAVKAPAGVPFYYKRSPLAATALQFAFPGVPTVPTVLKETLPITDLDKDQMADGWERSYSAAGLLPAEDSDADGLTNAQEYLLGGNPLVFDSPALPTVEMRAALGGVPRQAWVSFYAKRGFRYRLETKRAVESTWRLLGTSGLTGNDAIVSTQDTSYIAAFDRVARYYRVVGLAPADTDKDTLSDWEEVHVYGTNPNLADTDGDGTSDGVETRTPATRNALEYYDGRVVKLTPVVASQYAPVGEWMREAIAVKATSGRTILKNAPVDFVFTAGSGYLSATPGGDATLRTHLQVKTDATGTAHVWLWVPSTASTAIQLAAAARVIKDSTYTVYSTGCTVMPTAHLGFDKATMLTWLRADSDLAFAPSSGALQQWISPLTSRNAVVTSTAAPSPVQESRRGWLKFTGAERMSFGSTLAEDNFAVYFAAAAKADRTGSTASVAKSFTAGASGQRYLLGNTTPINGASLTKYSAPAKPGGLRFSLWEQLSGFPVERFPGVSRPYIFSPASGRIDNTNGTRMSPAPTGSHSRRSVTDVVDAEVSKSKTMRNWNYTHRKVDTKSFFYLGTLALKEDFYEVTPTTWRGSASSSSFGGVATLDTSKVGEVAAGLSVGKKSVGGFELRNSWLPSMTGSASGANSTGFIAAWRVNSSRQDIEIAGVPKVTGIGSYSTKLLGPKFIGGTDATTQGYIGNLGDVLIFSSGQTSDNNKAIHDYLGTVYRGQVTADADKDKLPDWWEKAALGDYTRTAAGDLDLDGISNLDEYKLGLNPAAADTDGDTRPDKIEFLAKQKANTLDTDGDLIPDNADALPTSATNGLADANTNGKTDTEDYLQANPSRYPDLDANGTADVLELFAE